MTRQPPSTSNFLGSKRDANTAIVIWIAAKEAIRDEKTLTSMGNRLTKAVVLTIGKAVPPYASQATPSITTG